MVGFFLVKHVIKCLLVSLKTDIRYTKLLVKCPAKREKNTTYAFFPPMFSSESYRKCRKETPICIFRENKDCLLYTSDAADE